MLKPIFSILPQTIKKRGLSRQFQSAHVCAGAKKIYPELNIISYKNGSLKIGAKSSSEANEIKNKEEEIIGAINTELKHETVRKIRTVGLEL